jgi:hypothetical protein
MLEELLSAEPIPRVPLQHFHQELTKRDGLAFFHTIFLNKDAIDRPKFELLYTLQLQFLVVEIRESLAGLKELPIFAFTNKLTYLSEMVVILLESFAFNWVKKVVSSYQFKDHTAQTPQISRLVISTFQNDLG